MGLGKILVMRAGVCERQEKKGAGKAGNRKKSQHGAAFNTRKGKEKTGKDKKGAVTGIKGYGKQAGEHGPSFTLYPSPPLPF